jgi:hypothetical protein
MNPDGSAVERLTADDGVDDAEPAWSPGGELLAISRWFCSWEWCLRTIWLMSPAGSGAYPWTALNPECETHTQPSWSPDGRKIAFTSTDYCAEPAGGVATVHAVRRTGAERYTAGVPITPGADPSWRPSDACGDRPCDDGNVCTADACDAATGCVHLAADGPCDDGSSCTVDDACSGGACAGRVPAEVCEGGLDDDCDGLVDGADPDCQPCTPTPEICDNGLDDDCNGLVDDWTYCCGCAVHGRLCGDDGFCYDCLYDGVQNGQESDVDCGALCGQQCADGQRCWTDPDCASGACVDFVCASRGP